MYMNNKLFYGDNLDVLRKYIKDGSIDLCYIDPPFNSKRNYNQIYLNQGKEDSAQAQAFIDTWNWAEMAEDEYNEILLNEKGLLTKQTVLLIEGLQKVLGKGSLLAYLVSMTLRISEIHRVLKDTGSFYLHCDPTASHYLKLVCDGIFCTNGGDYKNEIVWRRTGQHNKVKRYAPIHDVIFYYTKSSKYVWNYPKKPFMKGHISSNFVHTELGYKTNYYGNVLTGSGIRNGDSGKKWKGFDPTAKGRHWAIPGALLNDLDEDISELSQHEKLDYLYNLGMITIKEGEAWPIYERYLNDNDGQTLSDIWAFQPYTNGLVFNSDDGIDEDVRWLSAQDSERLGYPTQKPEGLLKRIINASTNEGDTILDAYCGCGTTVTVAQELKRNWIGIDITYQSISLILKRLHDSYGKKISGDIELNGVPKDFESAVALANKQDDRTRKEFEKWCVLTYSDNRAMINEKKGKDFGIDGVAFIPETNQKGDNELMPVLFSVKSDLRPHSSYVRDLVGTMTREGAVIGVMILLHEPTRDMINEAKQAGKYKNKLFNMEFEKVKIVTVNEILNGQNLVLPQMPKVLKEAKRKPDKDGQRKLDF